MSSDKFDFDQIYAAFRPKIHRYLVSMVGEYEAEDLVQEVFVKICQSLKAFRGESELSTWIYRIATNAAVDRLRSPSFQKNVQKCSVDPLEGNDDIELEDRNYWTGEKVPLVEQQVYRKEMNGCVQDYINHLPDAYRTVLILSEFEGLNNNEIAEIVGVTLNTVKIRLYRARERLKEDLSTNCASFWVEGNEFVPELKRSDLESLTGRSETP
jgi:RNA polymerase sigma-70 factor (ECF subfamily)